MEGHLTSWLKQLQELELEIVHRAGCKHLNADALSRISCSQCGCESHATDAGQSISATVLVTTGGESDLITGFNNYGMPSLVTTTLEKSLERRRKDWIPE